MRNAEIAESTKSMTAISSVALRHSAFIIPHSAFKKLLFLRQIVTIMSILLFLFGLLAGCLLAVIVGLVGSHRRIGFGWAFLLSVAASPIIGLIVTLCTPKLETRERKWGCLGTLIGIVMLVLLVVVVLMLLPDMYEQLQSWFQSLK